MKIQNIINNFESWKTYFVASVLLDMLFTLSGISKGFEEANPVVKYFIVNEDVVSLILPFFVVSGFMIALSFIEDAWKKASLKNKIVLWFIAISHSVVTWVGWIFAIYVY